MHKSLLLALTFIDTHLAESFVLDDVSRAACLSKYHLHRMFASQFNMNIGDYVRQRKLYRASMQLLFRPQMTITDIAYSGGYEHAESFSRAFKSISGQSPMTFRRSPIWDTWMYRYQLSLAVKEKRVMNKPAMNDVSVEFLSDICLAVVEHKGAPQAIGASVAKLIAWRRANGNHPSTHRTFNILYNNPAEVLPSEYRMDIGAEVKAPRTDNDVCIIEKVIPSGRYAVLRHIGSDRLLSNKIGFLYGEWLAERDETPSEFPLFIERISFFPDVPEDEMITDIYLPLAE